MTIQAGAGQESPDGLGCLEVCADLELRIDRVIAAFRPPQLNADENNHRED